MRYVVIAFVDTNLAPETVVNEIVSNLEFEQPGGGVVLNVSVLAPDGESVAEYSSRRLPQED